MVEITGNGWIYSVTCDCGREVAAEAQGNQTTILAMRCGNCGTAWENVGDGMFEKNIPSASDAEMVAAGWQPS